MIDTNLPGNQISVDRSPIDFQPGDSLLVAMLRAGLHPTGGGCLCLAGDCPHCLATVDGVGYVRTCQVAARRGVVVERHHAQGGRPPLIDPEQRESHVDARHIHCDVVVIGGGDAGREEVDRAGAAGKDVVTLDARDGQEVAGIYHGPLVVARSGGGTLCVYPREAIVVATGAAEIQPVAPGAELAGLVTARAARALAEAGIDLGRVVAVGMPPEGVDAERVEGRVVRFEGEGRVEAVVVAAPDERETRHECDTVSLGLGFQPRDALARMGRGLPVRVVGAAAGASDIPPCPLEGTVCPCSGVTVADLEHVWARGFHELELVKRATLAGTGTCQGSACLPHVRSFLAEKGRELQPPFTARPLTRQLTVGEIAAGACHHPTPRTPLHDEHLRLGARMDRTGGWWRPWTYGDSIAEYRAVREAVSVMDVSTLGKFLVSGPDTLPFLELLYPTKVSTLRPGRSRYVLLLDERGYVLDDGLICREGDDRFYLTLTSAGSTFGEMWIRDWAESRGFDVHLLNQTQSLGAINVTGPRAAELLAKTGVEKLPGFARHGVGEVAGVTCRILRLSFTGELSYELHHAAGDSVHLWRTLLELGQDMGIHPHGMDVLLQLRLEKGHIVVGQDTDFDSTPRRIHHEWAVKLDKPEFLGRQAVVRTGKVPPDRQLVGLEMDLPAPMEGAVLWNGQDYAGYVTSSGTSHSLGKAVMLAWLWLANGKLPETVTIEGRTARLAELPFYDSENERSRVKVSLDVTRSVDGISAKTGDDQDLGRFERLEATRIVASPETLDRLSLPAGAFALRTAPDELLVEGEMPRDAVDDNHALVERETSFASAWVEREEATRFLQRACPWALPTERPAFAQGAVAEIPVKLWFEEASVRFVVPAAYAADLEEQMT